MALKFFGFFSQHHCEICKKGTDEFLAVDEEKTDKYYCRAHLMESFSSVFLSCPYKMIIFHPELEKIDRTIYGYFSSRERMFKKEVNDKISELLNFTKGNCALCQNEAKVLYFPKGFLSYSKGLFGHTPLIEKIYPTSGELLCLKHALDKILPDLQSNKGVFDSGLYTPYDDGTYISAFA